MNRRGFLGLLASALVLDPERLLWRPGEKLISIPPSVRIHSISEALAAQIEFMRPKLEEMYLQSSILWEHIQDRDVDHGHGACGVRIPFQSLQSSGIVL